MKTKKTLSEKVITANRENAKKSTGPKRIAGKLAVRNNAAKHGLFTSRMTFQNGDEEQEFNTLVDDLHEEFKPKGILEALLVEEIATFANHQPTAFDFTLPSTSPAHYFIAVLSAADSCDSSGT